MSIDPGPEIIAVAPLPRVLSSTSTYSSTSTRAEYARTTGDRTGAAAETTKAENAPRCAYSDPDWSDCLPNGNYGGGRQFDLAMDCYKYEDFACGVKGVYNYEHDFIHPWWGAHFRRATVWDSVPAEAERRTKGSVRSRVSSCPHL